VKRFHFSHLLRDILILAVVTAISFAAIEIFCQAGRHESRYIYVIIDEGIPFSEVADRVTEAGLVRSPRVFIALGRALGIEHRAGAGRYRFKRTSDMATVLRSLYRGVSYRERVRVPSGLVLDRIAGILSDRAGVDSTLFMAYAGDSAFMATLGVPSSNAEGYLFPDTYDVEWNEHPTVLIRRMVDNFYRAFDDSLRERSKEMGFTVNEATTLASIIEKEAMLDSEKPKISAVFHNRLRRGMKLQADPTVRYALERWTGKIYYKHLDEPSPFNTYYARGLPPHPICNPERSSLLAALYPEEGSENLYFVATGYGTHTFTQRGADHNRAKAEYKRTLEAQRKARLEAEKAAAAGEEGGGEEVPGESGAGSRAPGAGAASGDSAAKKEVPKEKQEQEADEDGTG
jgi:UPF0755 protein